MKRILAICFCVVLMLLSLFEGEAKVYAAGLPAGKEGIEQLHGEYYNGAASYFKKKIENDDQRYQKVMNSTLQYIDFFASQHYSDIPAWERPILVLVKEGKYEEAIAEYAKQNQLEAYTAGSDTYNSINRYAQLLQLSGVREHALQSLEIYYKLTEIEQESNSLLTMSPLINLALDLRLYSMADQYYNKFRESVEGNAAKTAEVLVCRTIMLSRRNRPNEALTYGRRAVAMYDSLCAATRNEKFEALSRARIHLAMARIYNKLQEKEHSVQHIRSSRDCFEFESEVGGEENKIERLRALFSLAPMAADANEFFLADSIFTELDGMGSWLYDNDKLQQAQFKFNLLRFRGLTCYRVGKNSESRKYFEQASVVLDEMERLSPGENLEHHQNLNFNIASLYYQEKNYEKALELDRKVLALVLGDKIHDERKHNNDLSYCYKYIGNCQWAMAYQKYLDSKKRKTKAVMALYNEAFESYKTALRFNSRDAESQARYNLVDYILSGMQKPMGIPSNF